MLYAKKIIREIDLGISFPHIFFRYENLFVYDDVEERVKDVDSWRKKFLSWEPDGDNKVYLNAMFARIDYLWTDETYKYLFFPLFFLKKIFNFFIYSINRRRNYEEDVHNLEDCIYEANHHNPNPGAKVDPHHPRYYLRFYSNGDP